ncbi:MAG TPA: hypothetical protein VK837_06890 [Longimicrobiales bacterium]|nr:hypothetical protein [Longimicrobiales bacterium]
MKRSIGLQAAVAALSLLACEHNPTALEVGTGSTPFLSRSEGPAEAICHRTRGAPGFILIRVAAPALEGHLRHGDGLIGDPFPGLPAVFDENCRPSAAGVSYRESDSGDLFLGTLSHRIDFARGTNTVTGTMAFNPFSESGFPATDFDPFRFTIPEGAQLTDVSFFWSLTPSAGLTFARTDWRLSEGDATLASFLLDFYVASNPSSPFQTALPLPGGQYRVDNLLLSSDGTTNAWIVDYTWTFVVE